MIMTKSSANTEFLNVDLDLRAKRGLGILLQGLEPFAFVLHQTDKQASLELNGKSRPSLERTFLGLIKAVQSLPPEAATIWKNCDYRIFNVGVQAGREPYSTEFSISRRPFRCWRILERRSF
jgi:hypothetical protein